MVLSKGAARGGTATAGRDHDSEARTVRERAPYGEGFLVAKALQQMAAQATDSAARAFHNGIP
jgi:hypothetical protein